MAPAMCVQKGAGRVQSPSNMLRDPAPALPDSPRDRQPFSSARKFLSRVAGPRFVDGPIRAIALVLCLSGLMPGAAETHEPGYLTMLYLASALIVVSAVRPRIGALLAACGFVAFLALYPDYLNPFQEPIEFAAAVLLSAWRWPWSLGVTAGLVALTGISQVVQPELATPFAQLAFSWVLGSVLAVSAALAESAIQRELARRETAAREHERTVQQLRIGFAVDTHDTVSHSLATQAAMIRIISAERTPEAAQRRLGELALANGASQEQLRVLLGRLTRPTAESGARMMSAAELSVDIETMIAAAESGGYPITLQFDGSIAAMPAPRGEHVRSIARELITNMVKHAAKPVGCSLRVVRETENGIDALVLSSTNAATAKFADAPHSLVTRAEALGGSCVVQYAAARVEVTIRLPEPRL